MNLYTRLQDGSLQSAKDKMRSKVEVALLVECTILAAGHFVGLVGCRRLESETLYVILRYLACFEFFLG